MTTDISSMTMVTDAWSSMTDARFSNTTESVYTYMSRNSTNVSDILDCTGIWAGESGNYDYSSYYDLEAYYDCMAQLADCKDNSDVYDRLPGYRLCIHILLPIICTFGILGIIITVIVLSRKNMSTSTNCYLIALAITDLCFLLILVTKCFETKLTHVQHYAYAVIMTYTHIFLEIFLLASVWLTLMLAVERYIAICHPLRAMSICSVVRARIIIVIIMVVSVALRIPVFFKYKISFFYDPCVGKEVIWHTLTALGENETFHKVYSWSVNCILCALWPFSLLLFLNGCLIREIHRSTNYLRYHLASDSNVRTIITSEEIKITLMLISIVVVFFLCQAPYVLLEAIKSIKPNELFPHYHILTYVTILLLVLRSSCNFILYCWFSEKFWNTFRRTFCVPACLIVVAPRWLTSRVTGTNDEQANGNNNRKISYFNTKETIC